MFGETHYHTHNVRVEEKRAPTDDSVRLLKELEQKAFDKIVGTFELPSNVISSRVAVSKDVINCKNLFHIVVDINGKRHVCKVVTDQFQDRRSQVDQLYDELSKQLAQVIMPVAFEAALSERLF